MTADPAPGMKPDVVCRAEDLPFADGSFDVVACRTAAHHFSDVPAALAGMARVSQIASSWWTRSTWATTPSRPEKPAGSVVRNYTEAEWRAFVEGAGLVLEQVERTANSMDFAAWLAPELRGRGRARARALGRPRGGRPAHARRIALKTRVAG